jgi:hypothetical protein
MEIPAGARMTRFLTLCLLARTLAAQCPTLTPFTPPEKIKATDRAYRFEGGYVAVIGEMRVDSDGSPVAYHPLNLGTTHLCNGLDPVIDGKRVRDKKRATSPCFAAVEKAIQAKWDPARSPEFFIYGFVATGPKWGGPSGGKPIPVQGADDPAPGFFISTTARQVPGAAALRESQRYLNADLIPYVVVPRSLLTGGSLRRGGLAWVWNAAKGHTAPGVIGDVQSAFGEGSVALAQLVESGKLDPLSPAMLNGTGPVPAPYVRSGGRVKVSLNPKGPLVFVYFDGGPSPALSDYRPETLGSAVDLILARFGGAEGFKACLAPKVKTP